MAEEASAGDDVKLAAQRVVKNIAVNKLDARRIVLAGDLQHSLRTIDGQWWYQSEANAGSSRPGPVGQNPRV